VSFARKASDSQDETAGLGRGAAVSSSIPDWHSGSRWPVFVEGFQQRGVNVYDHLAVTSDWLSELLIPRRFS
jgi:hypothetical protein